MISIRRAVALAYRDFQLVADAMPAMTIMAVVLMIMFDAVIELQMPLGRGGTTALVLLIFVIGLVQVLFLTPYVIAVHRFIILGEVAKRYALAPGDPRNQAYFLWWACFAALAGAPMFLLAVPGSLSPGVLVLAAVYYGALLFGAVRLATLFAAIAVAAPGAGWRQALADSRGRVWRVFLVYAVAFLPAMLVAGLAQWLGGLSPSLVFAVVLSVFEGVVGFVIVTLYAVITSRLYQALRREAKGAA